MTIFDNRNDLNDLKRAKALLEHPGLAARLTGMLGMPIEKGFDLLPAGWHRRITALTRVALTKAVNTAVLTM
ncbi:MAG TPA: EcsC family protein, partial [Desulfosarcina sp.]|nr:EcsC family protein [Desulfosarcina sp.]